MSTPLLETKNIMKHFKVARGTLHAVDGVDMVINQEETMGVVGESGCGKSTLGRTILKLHSITDGQVLYKGNDITNLKPSQMAEYRKKMQLIFQDPYQSIDPRLSVSEIIGEPLRIYNEHRDKARYNKRIQEMMDTVGLARRLINTYPHELDGGRRQRIGIARALALNPNFIVCDEPVSALDVSIQAQILNLMMDLQRDMGLTYIFITHDLSVVKHISTNIMVMYLGKCVELAPAKELFINPKHPYTKALLSAIPVPNLEYRNKKREVITGEITSPINPKPICRFAKRCPNAKDSCFASEPKLKNVGENHKVSCFLY